MVLKRFEAKFHILIPNFMKGSNTAVFKRYFGAASEIGGTSLNISGTGIHSQKVSKTTPCLSVVRCSTAEASVTPAAAASVSVMIKSPEPEYSFHGRDLPKNLISLESAEGQRIFSESFHSKHAVNFFSLITNFASQSDVSMCGPASLAMVMNALRLDPSRVWKNPWRWWSDEMFACCEGSLSVMKTSGVTLDFFDRIAKNQEGISVMTRMPDNITEFKSALKMMATEQDKHVIVSFGREALGQTGIGHFSPVAAVHPEKEMVLVLDVARFKYPPYWVLMEDLYKAMHSADPTTGISRGYSIITKN